MLFQGLFVSSQVSVDFIEIVVVLADVAVVQEKVPPTRPAVWLSDIWKVAALVSI